jgi:hypothetical protein
MGCWKSAAASWGAASARRMSDSGSPTCSSGGAGCANSCRSSCEGRRSSLLFGSRMCPAANRVGRARARMSQGGGLAWAQQWSSALVAVSRSASIHVGSCWSVGVSVWQCAGLWAEGCRGSVVVRCGGLRSRQAHRARSFTAPPTCTRPTCPFANHALATPLHCSCRGGQCEQPRSSSAQIALARVAAPSRRPARPAGVMADVVIDVTIFQRRLKQLYASWQAGRGGPNSPTAPRSHCLHRRRHDTEAPATCHRLSKAAHGQAPRCWRWLWARSRRTCAT